MQAVKPVNQMMAIPEEVWHCELATPERIEGNWFTKDILSVDQFSRADLDEIFGLASQMRAVRWERGYSELLRGRVLVNLFYEASTRTDASFSIAMKRLGGEVHNIVGVQFSSVSKGETLEDTVRVLGGYADAIVLRHPQAGSAAAAAAALRRLRRPQHVPLLNAGDGVGEHPTQALLDVYTIERRLNRLDGLTIAMVGDLKHGRTVHSLAKLMALYEGTKLILVSPPELRMPSDLLDYLHERGVETREVPAIGDALAESDVFYVTRVQKERFSDESLYRQMQGSYQVNVETLGMMKPEAIVMHPLPRVGEIDNEVDDSPKAVYFEQAENGMYVRMALLALVLGNK